MACYVEIFTFTLSITDFSDKCDNVGGEIMSEEMLQTRYVTGGVTRGRVGALK